MSDVLMSAASFQTALPLRQRILILMLAIAAHGIVLSQPWLGEPGFAGAVPRALSVNIVQVASPRQVPALSSGRARPAVPERKPSVEPQPDESFPQYDAAQPDTGQTTLSSATESNSEPAQPDASALSDREPDYRAAYLDNPRPEYPLAARRMGWQGMVVLQVEVLADGSPGEVTVRQSSGRGVLDNAALRAVRGWRFVPARQNGQVVAQRLRVPIVFNLNAAE